MSVALRFGPSAATPGGSAAVSALGTCSDSWPSSLRKLAMQPTPGSGTELQLPAHHGGLIRQHQVEQDGGDGANAEASVQQGDDGIAQALDA